MDWIRGWSGSEWLFYGGIVVMAFVVAAAVLTGVTLVLARRRLNRKLEQEYGKPQR